MTFTVARLRVSFRLAASLDRVAKMPRIRFYNRRFTSRAPVRNTTSGDYPPSAVGNPAGLRLRDPPRPWRFGHSCEKDARPPRGHPASSSRVLDGTPPASGRPAFTCASARCAFAPVNPRLSELCRLPGSLAEASPLTPLIATGEGSRNRTSPVGEPGSIGARQCDPTFSGSRCLPSHETTFRAPLRTSLQWRAAFIGLPGLRSGMRAVTARAHRRSTCRPPARPSYRAPLFAGVSWAACAPTTSANDCLHEHDCRPLEHPTPPKGDWDDCRLD